MIGHLLPIAALAATFTAGVVARAVWDHERDLWQRLRAGTSRHQRLGSANAYELVADRNPSTET